MHRELRNLKKIQLRPLPLNTFSLRLLKTFKHFDFTLRKDSFKTQVNLFLRGKYQDFFRKIPKISYKVRPLIIAKKKKNLSKAKKARAQWGNFLNFLLYFLFETQYYIILIRAINIEPLGKSVMYHFTLCEELRYLSVQKVKNWFFFVIIWP